MTDEKRCRECGQYKPITEYYSEYRQVKYPSGRIGRKIFYKHKCKACTCAKRKTYIKDNKPKKSVNNDMAWAFSDKLEGVFYNRKRVN